MCTFFPWNRRWRREEIELGEVNEKKGILPWASLRSAKDEIFRKRATKQSNFEIECMNTVIH